MKTRSRTRLLKSSLFSSSTVTSRTCCRKALQAPAMRQRNPTWRMNCVTYWPKVNMKLTCRLLLLRQELRNRNSFYLRYPPTVRQPLLHRPLKLRCESLLNDERFLDEITKRRNYNNLQIIVPCVQQIPSRFILFIARWRRTAYNCILFCCPITIACHDCLSYRFRHLCVIDGLFNA